ncbi:NAD(+)/NADH kinase [Laceyella putida]|uniref:NAD kinase n=1 Tax=Laceyella putida TaxID=110101 RepID=A0ABW2RJ45_9BACL
MKTIGITVNQSKPKGVQVAEQLVHLLEKRKAKVVVDAALATQLKRPDLGLELEHFADHVQLVFVLGGDGTLLGMARRFAEAQLPILGFNLGQLGFLSEAEPDDLSMAVDRVLKGDYFIEQRLMLKAEVLRDGAVIETGTALNDIGIAKGSFGRMIQCTAYMDGMFLGTYSGDGLIVSTPTGSTAYSLSCGGPIVHPGIQVLLLTPICPHTLTSRPMVLPAEAVLEIHVSAVHHEMGITIDGQIGYCLKEGDVVRVKRSRTPAHLIKWQDRSFFEVVRKKLQGESVDSRVGGK